MENIEDQNNQISQERLNQPIIKPRAHNWKIVAAILVVMLIIFFLFVIVVLKSKNTKGVMKQILVPIPTTNNQPPTNIPPTDSTPSSKIEDFTNKELLGENDNYSVYLLNSDGKDTLEKRGGLIIYDKKNKTVVNISGTFSIFGATRVVDDNKGRYILLSTGTSMSRKIIPLSLTKKTLAVKEFCATSNFLFYKDYVIYGNCDTFQNRPWEAGQAASLIVLNLNTSQEKIIAKSDLTHQYGPLKIAGDTLYYQETSVLNEEDWQNLDKQKTSEKTFDLLSL